LAAVILFLGALLTFYRWYVLVRAQGLPFTRTNALRLGLIGFAFSTLLPGSIGGDLVKAFFIAREQSRRTVAVATVLIDRAMGLWGIIWMVALLGGTFWALENPAILGSKSLQSLIVTAILITAGTVGLWFLLGILPTRRAERFAGRLGGIPRVGPMAAEFWRAIWMYRQKGKAIAWALLISLASQVCFILAFFYAALVFQEPGGTQATPSLLEHFVIIPIGTAIEALSPTPGGVGGAEAGFGWLYTLVGQPEANGVLGSLAKRGIGWGLAILSYFVYLRMRPALAVERPVVEEESADLQLSGIPEAVGVAQR
jgi:uncharacterized membrane protein YbhN (UPF0104 family)